MASNQELIFACIEAGSFNRFDGPTVVAALRANAGLWRAVVFSDEYQGALLLRDLPGDMHLSALYIASSGADDRRLEGLMAELKADEVDWQGDYPWRERGGRVLRAWWD